MRLSCGLLGLPNVGKSTLFNALSGKRAAEAANFPFCTIEPNKGQVLVPDERLEKLAELSESASVIPSFVEVVDIAGLVKGAHKGEGLGNQFLGHVRQVNTLLHVVRCFEDPNVTHVDGTVDPVRDAEIIETELLMADLESLSRQIPALEKKVRHMSKELAPLLAVLKKAEKLVNEGISLRVEPFSEEEKLVLNQQGLLSIKPLLYVLNVSEKDLLKGNAFTKLFEEKYPQAPHLRVSAAIESEIAALSSSEQALFLQDLGLSHSGIARLSAKAYELLDLLTFFTTGPKETRAWSFTKGATAPEAAGLIHGDFERGFIAAEVCSFEDFVHAGGELPAKSLGKVRIQGKDYVMQDGDVVYFRFNV